MIADVGDGIALLFPARDIDDGEQPLISSP
jgi:hypothetical protein